MAKTRAIITMCLIFIYDSPVPRSIRGTNQPMILAFIQMICKY